MLTFFITCSTKNKYIANMKTNLKIKSSNSLEFLLGLCGSSFVGVYLTFRPPFSQGGVYLWYPFPLVAAYLLTPFIGDLGIFPLVILGELLLFFRNPFTKLSWLALVIPFLTLQESFNCFSDNTPTGFSMIFTGDGPDNKQSFSGDNLDGVDCCSFLVIDTASVEFFTIFSSLISEALSKIKSNKWQI